MPGSTAPLCLLTALQAVGFKPPADWRRRSVRRLRTAGGPRAPERVRAWLQATTNWLPDELEANLVLLTCELVNNSVLHGEASGRGRDRGRAARHARPACAPRSPIPARASRRPAASARSTSPAAGAWCWWSAWPPAGASSATSARASGSSSAPPASRDRLSHRQPTEAACRSARACGRGSGSSSKWSASAAMIGMPRPPRSSWAAGLSCGVEAAAVAHLDRDARARRSR